MTKQERNDMINQACAAADKAAEEIGLTHEEIQYITEYMMHELGWLPLHLLEDKACDKFGVSWGEP